MGGMDGSITSNWSHSREGFGFCLCVDYNTKARRVLRPRDFIDRINSYK